MGGLHPYRRVWGSFRGFFFYDDGPFPVETGARWVRGEWGVSLENEPPSVLPFGLNKGSTRFCPSRSEGPF